MKISRGPVLRSLLTVLVVVVSALAMSSVASPASAAEPTIEIVSPTQTASGEFDFTVAITQNGTQRTINYVYFEIYGASQGWQKTRVNVDAGDCVATCTVSAHFDSDGSLTADELWQAAVRGAHYYVSEMGDGAALFHVEAWSGSGIVAKTSRRIDIDNHRPVFSAPAITYHPLGNPAPRWKGAVGSLSTTVAGTPNATTGQPIVSYRLFLLSGRPSGHFATIDAPAPVDGGDTITFNTRDLPSGLYPSVLIAIDATGRESSFLSSFEVDLPSPYSVNVAFPAPFTDEAVATITPTWLDQSEPAETWIESVKVLRDGVVVADVEGLTDTHGPFDVVLSRPDGGKMRAGAWNFTVTTLDNRGIAQTVLASAQIRDPVTAVWPSAPAGAGVPTARTVVIHNDSRSPLSAATLSVDGQEVSSIDASGSPRTLTMTVPTESYSAGSHVMSVTATLANGRAYDFSNTFTVIDPLALVMSAPASAAWGGSGTFVAHATSKGSPAAGLALVLQFRAAGSGTWVRRAEATTDSAGAATFVVPIAPDGSGEWRVESSGTATIAPATSTASAVAVTGLFTKLPKSVRAKAGRAFKTKLGVASPRGTRVVLQYRPRKGSWRPLTSAAIVSTGSVTLKGVLHAPGKYQMRARLVGSSHVETTTSARWRVRVVR